jgi:hypothetical protein
MIGCWVAWKYLVACWLRESSQQPTWPQVRQIRKCSHTLPLFQAFLTTERARRDAADATEVGAALCHPLPLSPKSDSTELN